MDGGEGDDSLAIHIDNVAVVVDGDMGGDVA